MWKEKILRASITSTSNPMESCNQSCGQRANQSHLTLDGIPVAELPRLEPIESKGKKELSIYLRNGYYSVLQCSDAFPKDKLMHATYKLCWNTVHSTSALSYVSPAYYADKLCEYGLLYLKPLIDGYLILEKLNTTCFKLTKTKKNP
jgi:hypothetical protein